MMFDIPLPCTESREIGASGIVDEADGYLSAVAGLVHDHEVIWSDIAPASIEGHAARILVCKSARRSR